MRRIEDSTPFHTETDWIMAAYGRVITARDLNAPAGFVLRLRRIENVHYASSAGSIKDKRKDVIRWEAEHTLETPASSSRGVPVEFAIPRSAAKDGTGDPTRWTLEVEAVVEGSRYDALFGVPVITAPAE